jgi:hypothetical protein
MKSRVRCGNPSYRHYPDPSDQTMLVESKDFSDPASYPIANNRAAYSPSGDDSQPRCAFTSPL